MNERDETAGAKASERATTGGDETTPGGVGDVESAGETTAAAAINRAPVEQKPVGADTRVRVEGEPHPSGGE